MVGDSITAFSHDALTASMPQAEIDGIGGINLADGWVTLVRPAVAEHPHTLVIELGINSAMHGWDAAQEMYLQAILQDVANVPCVVWVTPDSQDTTIFDPFAAGTLHERIGQFQTSLRSQVAATTGHVRIADWGSIERQHPEFYVSDGVHPTTIGSTALAGYVASQVDQCLW